MLDTGGKGDKDNTDCSRKGEVLIAKLLSFNQVMMFLIFLTQLKVTMETTDRRLKKKEYRKGERRRSLTRGKVSLKILSVNLIFLFCVSRSINLNF